MVGRITKPATARPVEVVVYYHERTGKRVIDAHRRVHYRSSAPCGLFIPLNSSTLKEGVKYYAVFNINTESER